MRMADGAAGEGGSDRGQAGDSRTEKSLDLFFGSTKPLEGPLSVLEKAMRTKQRVLVVTRHGSGVRGVCLGLVSAFDKHFNVVLRDVDERYTVLHKRAPDEGASGASAKRWKKKLGYYKRHLPQVLLRGEGIVLVSLSGGAGGEENAAMRYFGGQPS